MMERSNLYSSNEDSGFNTKNVILAYFRYWPWFLLSLVISLIISFIYLRYEPKVYRTSASVIIKEEEGAGSTSASDVSTFIDLGMLGGMGSNKIENEIGVLKSRRLMGSVFKSLNLSASIFLEGDVRDLEVYSNKPVEISILSYSEESIPKNLYRLVLRENSNIILTDLETNNVYRFEDGIVGDVAGMQVVFDIKRNFTKSFLVQFNNIESKAKKMSEALRVNQPTDAGSLLEISLLDYVPEKSEDIINELIFQYNREAIEDKNLVARNTRDFIDERLKIINEELDSVETNKEQFKEINSLTDIQAESQLFIENASVYRNQAIEVNTQLELVNNMINFLESSRKTSTLPANMSLEGDAISSQIEEYNKLIISRNRILSNSTNENPIIIKLDSQIDQMKKIVLESLERMRENLRISAKQLSEQNSSIRAEISNVPNKERIFREIVRQQNIKENLYLYLLQKREENSLSLAVKAPKAKIVDVAFTNKIPVSPNNNVIVFVACFFGFLVPFSIIYLKRQFNNSVINKTELVRLSNDIPILGELPKVNNKEADLIEENDRSVLAEAFRMLLTNLQYLLVEKIKNSDDGIITFVTSTVKGEGKTFVSFNLAMTMANTSKKVLIVGADLRNPQLQRYQRGAKQMLGLSDYLVNENLSLKEVVSSSELNNNLDFLPSGSIPPNPSELLQLKRTDDLFVVLKKKYDYIIVDTAPSMVVADTFLINHLADVTVHVVRAKYTDKKLVQFAVDSKREGKFKNLAFVLNDVDSADFGYYGNKYGYAYGYGNDQESFLSKIKNRFR